MIRNRALQRKKQKNTFYKASDFANEQKEIASLSGLYSPDFCLYYQVDRPIQNYVHSDILEQGATGEAFTTRTIVFMIPLKSNRAVRCLGCEGNNGCRFPCCSNTIDQLSTNFGFTDNCCFLFSVKQKLFRSKFKPSKMLAFYYVKKSC